MNQLRTILRFLLPDVISDEQDKNYGHNDNISDVSFSFKKRLLCRSHQFLLVIYDLYFIVQESPR